MRNFRLTDEGGHQEAIIQWCQYRKGIYPELDLLYHVPNGGKRDRTTATVLKRQGVKAGVPDLVLPVARSGYHGLYVELKAPGGKLEPSQVEYLEGVEQQGYLALVCVGWQAAVEALADYLEEKEIKAQDLHTKTTTHEGIYRVRLNTLKAAGSYAAEEADGGVFMPAT